MYDTLISTSSLRAVPWHNSCRDTYFFGNSVVGASGTPEGEWTFLIGPDYTSPNYLRREVISLVFEGAEYPLAFQMKRLRGSGVFFGTAEAMGFRIALWDYAPFERQEVLRHIHVADLSGAERKAALLARITPHEAETDLLPDGICIRKDTSRYCFGNRETLNWALRCCDIRWTETAALSSDGESFLLTAVPSADGTCTLVHRCFYENDSVSLLPDPRTLLQDTLQGWADWLSLGTLPSAPTQRDSDALESLLLCVKMQQNRGGGAIAGIRKYANSYIRDTHGCMRMLLAAGHTEETAALLRNIHSRWTIAGYIPNWWSMGSDSFIGGSFHNDAAEITAYYLFMARDYLACTGNTALITAILPSLRWAAEAQLSWLCSHDYTMDFNGDETEQYCCNADGEEYGGFPNPSYGWDHSKRSFSSTVAALCSLEWYAALTGEDLSRELSALREKIQEVFYDPARGIHLWNAEPSANGWQRSPIRMTNYQLFPLWIGAKLPESSEKTDALSLMDTVRPDGLLPNSPDVPTGFCGHTAALFLYDMVCLNEPEAALRTARGILDSPLLSMYGTVSEFYGPSCVPNGHNCRGFEGGITGEALMRCFAAFSPNTRLSPERIDHHEETSQSR